jgi:glucosamine kinase
MKRDIYIGVDGGGTKTKIRIENTDGQLIGHAIGGPANIRLSQTGAWHSILTAINDALRPLAISLEHPDYAFHAGFGLAGCEVLETYHAFLKYPHPFATLRVVSDAHIACLGAHANEEGAIIIVGTGAVGYQIIDGKGMQVSGYGFPHDDEGSGAWIGLLAIQHTFHCLDQRTEKSPLAADVFTFFNRDKQHMIAWANQATSTEFARLAPLVINHSQHNEIAAVRIMKKAAQAIDRIAQGLEKMRDHAIPCSLFGGIAPFIEPWLSNELRHSLVSKRGDACDGAIWMIQQEVTT